MKYIILVTVLALGVSCNTKNTIKGDSLYVTPLYDVTFTGLDFPETIVTDSAPVEITNLQATTTQNYQQDTYTSWYLPTTTNFTIEGLPAGEHIVTFDTWGYKGSGYYNQVTYNATSDRPLYTTYVPITVPLANPVEVTMKNISAKISVSTKAGQSVLDLPIEYEGYYVAYDYLVGGHIFLDDRPRSPVWFKEGEVRMYSFGERRYLEPKPHYRLPNYIVPTYLVLMDDKYADAVTIPLKGDTIFLEANQNLHFTVDLDLLYQAPAPPSKSEFLVTWETVEWTVIDYNIN